MVELNAPVAVSDCPFGLSGCGSVKLEANGIARASALRPALACRPGGTLKICRCHLPNVAPWSRRN